MKYLTRMLCCLSLVVSGSLFANTPPIFTKTVSNQTIPMNGSKGPLSFTVSDAESSSSSIKMKKFTSNSSLLPTSRISFVGGSGANRVITLTPMPNQTGTARVTVQIRDPQGATNTMSFSVTVPKPPNAAPTMSNISNTSVVMNSSKTLFFTVADDQTPAGSLTLSKSSTNSSLLPANRLSFVGGSGANRQITITPIEGRCGSSDVTVTVKDQGNKIDSDTFRVTVSNPSAPSISGLSNIVVQAGLSNGPYLFTVSDAESEASTLTLSKASTNTSVLPIEDISFIGGSGSNRQITITPDSSAYGTSAVTIATADECGKTSGEDFTVTVNAQPEFVTPLVDVDMPMNSAKLIEFVVNDKETTPGQITLSKATDNAELLPLESVSFVGGVGADRDITLTPVAGKTGVANITVTLHDPNGGETSATFKVTVTNNEPKISSINDHRWFYDDELVIPFTLEDETSADDLNLEIASDSDVVQQQNISVEGQGSQKRLRLPITRSQSATTKARITVTVTDELSLSEQVTFDVYAHDLARQGLATDTYFSLTEAIPANEGAWRFIAQQEKGLNLNCQTVGLNKTAKCRKAHVKYTSPAAQSGKKDVYEFEMTLSEYDDNIPAEHIIVFQEWSKFNPLYENPRPITTIKIVPNSNDQPTLGLFDNSWQLRLCGEGEDYPLWPDAIQGASYPYCWNGLPNNACPQGTTTQGDESCDEVTVKVDEYQIPNDSNTTRILERRRLFSPPNRQIDQAMAPVLNTGQTYRVKLIIKHGNFDVDGIYLSGAGAELWVDDNLVAQESYQTKDGDGDNATSTPQFGQYWSQEYNAYKYFRACNDGNGGGSWCGKMNQIELKNLSIKLTD